MRMLSFIILLVILTSIIITKLVVTDQENEIKILNQEILILQGEIEKIKTDMTYITNPQNLKEINQDQFKLTPIEEEDTIKLEN
ncbi:MAG: hypothetical protein CMM95_00700 [Rickettsiales bacterium]|nr:hypothetical protein [Rickettsiales bacterium]|tara:strand:+ start:1715 stop:1966 length:252 start_codon:yes stop_codon:yes gene_type:complete